MASCFPQPTISARDGSPIPLLWPIGRYIRVQLVGTRAKLRFLRGGGLAHLGTSKEADVNKQVDINVAYSTRKVRMARTH